MKTSKRNDPGCEEIRGWVEQDIARKFKAICVEQGKNYSEGLREALIIAIERWGQN